MVSRYLDLGLQRLMPVLRREVLTQVLLNTRTVHQYINLTSKNKLAPHLHDIYKN